MYLMKVIIINGTSHKGSTYHIARLLAEKISGDIKEFFLPRDFGEFCVGCTKCFMKSETKCPHYEKLKSITEAIDEADIIITNPPFSLFDEFVLWIVEAQKKFLIIGNQNNVTHKDIFPLIQQNQIWLGKGFKGNAAHFISEYEDHAVAGEHIKGMIRVSGVFWYTNLDHGRRHQPFKLMSMEDNVKYSKHKEIRGIGYPKYENYDAIEVPYSDAIPNDYEGLMGVPITFLNKYCPDQFELIGFMASHGKEPKGIPNEAPYLNGKWIYSRIVIRKKV